MLWNVAYQTALHCTRESDYKLCRDNTTKFCTSFLVVHAVLRLPFSVLLASCEPQPGRRLEVGTAPWSELLFEVLLVREQDTSDRDQVKWFECLDMTRVVKL